MLTEPDLLALLSDLESFRVERTVSTTDTAKFSQAICAFANDLHNARLPGFLLIGVDAETIAENRRSIEHQLASLRFFDLNRNYPTYAGIILFAKDPLNWLPNAYVQYVRFEGTDMAAEVSAEKRFQGDLLSIVRDLRSFVSLITSTRPVRRTALEEVMVSDYPEVAEALRTLGAINRFGRGVERAQLTLARNGSPPAEFEFGDTFFGVTIKTRP